MPKTLEAASAAALLIWEMLVGPQPAKSSCPIVYAKKIEPGAATQTRFGVPSGPRSARSARPDPAELGERALDEDEVAFIVDLLKEGNLLEDDAELILVIMRDH
jgi:hypothetical protein